MKHKIYALTTSKRPYDIYIGWTTLNLTERRRLHISACYTKKTDKDFWLRDLIESQEDIIIAQIDEACTAKEAEMLEMTWISKYRSLGYNVLNKTLGGLGCRLPKTEEQKKVLSKLKDPVKKPVIQFSIDGRYIYLYESLWEAYRITHVDRANIRRNCRLDQKTAGGYIWQWAD